jgi:hypothetical protein
MYHGTVFSHFERHLKMEKKFLYYRRWRHYQQLLEILTHRHRNIGVWCLMLSSSRNVDKRTIADFDRFLSKHTGSAYCMRIEKSMMTTVREKGSFRCNACLYARESSFDLMLRRIDWTTSDYDPYR